MNLVTIRKPADIDKCQKEFAKNLKVGSKDMGIRRITFRPDTADERVHWLRDREVWASFTEGENRYWNPFGTEDPSTGKNLGITIEINFPYEEIDRKIGGAFAREPVSGKTYVIHRGIMGGGKRGIGKSTFFSEYREGLVTILDEGKGESPVALVGELGSRDLPETVTAFVKEVERVKKALVTPTQKPPVDAPKPPHFTPEYEGLREYESHAVIKARTNHGRVVRNLEAKLTELGTTSNIPTDDRHKPDIHFMHKDRRRGDYLFEVKTDTTPGNVYGAIGQLEYYSQLFRTKPRTLVAVFPENLEENRKNRLRTIGIQVVTFRLLSGDSVGFSGLKGLL